MAAEYPFAVMVKPVGSACNMRCRYCYYLDAPGSSAGGVMSEEVLAAFIRNYIASSPGPVLSITWHGGEPSLAGIDFYKRAVALEKQYLPQGWECWNSLQTNGLALDEEWFDFLSEAHFDVGVSIDGTEAVHDANRRDAGGQPTWGRIRDNILRLKERGIRADLLCTVTEETAAHGREVYRALADLDTGWMQFIPIVVREDPSVTVRAESYGRFLKDVFFEWFFHDLGRTEVQLFSEMARVLAGGEANLCTMAERCGLVPVIEKDGSVFSCDHFVKPSHRIGNVREDSLADLLQGPAQRAFGDRREQGLTAACRACPYLFLCHGGCLKDRFAVNEEGERGQYCLCRGLRDFFDYAVPHLKRAMALSAQKKSSREIMAHLAQEERQRFKGVSRNETCPCGSGLKFKYCCARRVP